MEYGIRTAVWAPGGCKLAISSQPMLQAHGAAHDASTGSAGVSVFGSPPRSWRLQHRFHRRPAPARCRPRTPPQSPRSEAPPAKGARRRRCASAAAPPQRHGQPHTRSPWRVIIQRRSSVRSYHTAAGRHQWVWQRRGCRCGGPTTTAETGALIDPALDARFHLCIRSTPGCCLQERPRGVWMRPAA